MVELYILLIMSCTNNVCTYDATKYDDLTKAQCEAWIPIVQSSIPSRKRAVCVPIDFE